MSRGLSHGEVMALASSLGGPEREVITATAKLRLATHAQLAALLGLFETDLSAGSAARSSRRALAGLTAMRVLARLQRRIGGRRAGSAGYVYYLGPVGQRLVAYWQGRG